jgi:catalase
MDGTELEVNHTVLTAESVLFDALYAAGGIMESRKFGKDAAYFIKEAYSHFKPIGATHEGKDLLKANGIGKSPGVVIGGKLMKSFAIKFVEALSAHRHWDRQLV